MRVLTISVSILVILLGFQNCGPGFKTDEASISALEGGQSTSSPPPVAQPVVNLAPQISAPSVPLSLGMNAPNKILIPITDSDTSPALVNFVIRAAPQQGQLTLDPGTVPAAERGVTYTPNVNYVGADSFVLNVIDPQGNMGPDQTFNVRVDTKGLGQIVGRFVKANCTPTTSPVTGTYISNLATFELRQTVYSQDCSVPVFENIMTGNHAIGLENVMALGGTLAFEYNITNFSNTIRPLSAVAAQALNAQNYCGLNGWAANVVRNVAATGCNGFWVGANIFMYRRVEFPVGQPPRLFYSSQTGGNGNTPQTRTGGLDLATPFIRQ